MKTNGRRGGSSRASPPLRAVLFDMDGVVTDTAAAHATAWKRLFDELLRARAERGDGAFVPFDADHDYRRYVDGKSRYDGVANFLAARGIPLPQGDPDDGPERESVCGLGNRKNRYFLRWLEEHRVATYPTTLALVDALRTAGIKTAVFSASRNCGAVLQNAGVEDRFDARVDGADLARLGLPGKPDPAMLEAAAARLGVGPDSTAVAEDSLAGVAAGARGGFAWVVGVDRADHARALAEAGAHRVVADLGELTLDRRHRLVVKCLDTLASVWDAWGGLRERLAGRHPALFLDYDGTLTPIVADPDEAHLPAGVRETLAGLARRWPVAIVSGRALDDVRARVGVEDLYYAGSHGFELAGPGFHEVAERAEACLPALDEAERGLRERLAGIAGHRLERKPFAIAVHYRQVADAHVARVEAAVDRAVSAQPRLRKGYGKKLFLVQPRIDWHKGRAVLWLLARLGLDDDETVPVYIGDDLTDEDAFRVLAGRGVGIAVRGDQRPTSADWALADPEDVARFLEALRASGDPDT